MTRLVALLLICVVMPGGAWAQSAQAGSAFGTVTAAAVWGAALSYIAPRSLQALTMPQMTIWGLNGLAALDPDLNTTLQNGQIRLTGPQQLIIAVPAPAANDAAGWGRAAARVAAAAFSASPALQQAGTQGVISSFFDELFNHFDPYSRYEAPVQAAQDQLLVMGLAGTGITFSAEGNQVVMAAIAADSPAENAGLTVGEVVKSVAGIPAYPGEVAAFNAEMSGLYGSNVTLQYLDPAQGGAPQSVTLVRGFIPPQSVYSEPAPGPGIIALRITAFNRGTSDQFSTALAAALAEHTAVSGLILDLRGNRGGILRQAVLAADALLPSGPIAQAAGRDPDADQQFSAEGSDLTGGARLVVLVNGQTASAAEILAAALADDGRAVVVGSETLGKGLVQTVTALPDGGELYVTWSRVLAPRGWPLQTLGVMPQVCTSLGELAMQSQLSALQRGQNLMAPAVAQARQMRPGINVDAILQVRDECPADLGGDIDLQAAAYLLNDPKAYQAALLH